MIAKNDSTLMPNDETMRTPNPKSILEEMHMNEGTRVLELSG